MGIIAIGIQRHMENRAYLREYRERAGLTLKQAAHKMGVVAQTIHKWEQGQNSPSIPDLIRLATVYAIPPSAFFQSPDGLAPRAWDDASIEVMAKLAGIHPLALRWIEGDFSKLDEAIDLTGIINVFQRLSPTFRNHWLEAGKNYPPSAWTNTS